MIFLSHTIQEDTPLYGNNGTIHLRRDQSISVGDSCNTSTIQMSNHAGTHVDAPGHFFENGATVESFGPKEWIFDHPLVIEADITDELLIRPERFLQNKLDRNADFVIVKSGFEKCRDKEMYWQANPGLAADMAEFLQERCPKIRAVGMDFISISSFQNRGEGRKAHTEFLKRNILIFEDMSLTNIPAGAELEKVIALPLRFQNADGAPVTVVGVLK